MAYDRELSELINGYCELFVGTEIDTGAPAVVWVLPDGRMLTFKRVHCRSQGRTAPGEVMTAFGLTQFRRFSPATASDAWHYAVELATQREVHRRRR